MSGATADAKLNVRCEVIDASIVRRTAPAVVFAAVTACGLSPGTASANGDSPSATPASSEIAAAWQQRERRAERFRAEWIHERTYTKFWANCHVPFARDEYVTLRFNASRLVVDGDRLRFDSGAVDECGVELRLDDDPVYDHHGRGAHDDAQRVFRDDRIRYDGGRPRVDPREPAAGPWPRNLRPFTTVFDGRRNLQYLPADHGSEPEAYWFSGRTNRFQTSLHYLPLILAVRPSWLGVSPEDCRIEPVREAIQGRECCVLVARSGQRREFWLDPERDFIVLSYREDCNVLGARMQNRIDIQYRQDATGLWLPDAWTTAFFDNHGLMEQHAPATVLTATTNAKISGDAFATELPRGTWVYDEESGEHHIIGTDGTRQPIAAAELREGLTHAQLIARESWLAQAGRAIRSAWRQTWSRFVLFLMLFGGASLWMQRRRECHSS